MNKEMGESDLKILDKSVSIAYLGKIELHSDLEQLLLENGSKQQLLYGINIYYDNGEIEFDSLINPPRNREAGYPRVGRGVADPKAREKIVEVVNKWIEL